MSWSLGTGLFHEEIHGVPRQLIVAFQLRFYASPSLVEVGEIRGSQVQKGPEEVPASGCPLDILGAQGMSHILEPYLAILHRTSLISLATGNLSASSETALILEHRIYLLSCLEEQTPVLAMLILKSSML